METDDPPAAEVDGPPVVVSGAAWTRALGRLASSGQQLHSLPPVRALGAQSLTAPGGVVLALLVLTPGVLLDLVTDGTLGLPTTIGFVLAAAATALTVRNSALGTAAVLPPLLFAGAVLALAWLSGQNEGLRELALDAGTTLALSAPVLFTGTALTLAVVVGRLAWRIARR